MTVERWWPKLRPETREWLIANNGDAVPVEIVDETPDDRRHKADGADVRRADRGKARLGIRDGIVRPQYRRRKANETRGMSLCLASS